MGTYNIYCDESCHLENDKKPFMLISYCKIPYNQLKMHKESIKDIRKKHNFYNEIKWSKVSRSKYLFYKELLEYFFKSEISFRSVIVNKENIDNHKFQQTHDDFYYKMYYQLLQHKLDLDNTYNIYLDIKDTLSSNKVAMLKDILRYNFSIRNVQNVHSKESVFVQLADLIMGAVNYKLRELDNVIAKNKLIEYIENQTGMDFKCSSYKSEEKFNLFHINI